MCCAGCPSSDPALLSCPFSARTHSQTPFLKCRVGVGPHCPTFLPRDVSHECAFSLLFHKCLSTEGLVNSFLVVLFRISSLVFCFMLLNPPQLPTLSSVAPLSFTLDFCHPPSERPCCFQLPPGTLLLGAPAVLLSPHVTATRSFTHSLPWL